MKKSIAVDIISSLLILLFVYTALSKLMAADRFADVLWQAPLIRYGAGVIAWAVPLLELFIALLLFFKKSRLAGLYAALTLLLLFTAYLVFMLAIESDLPCQCGGVLNSMSWKVHVLFNSAFILLTGAGIVWERERRQEV